MATPAEPLVADAADARAATRAGELLANASLEVALREAGKLPEAAPLLPSGTCVYVPSLPARPLALSLPVLAAIRAQGLDPVPHVAARRVASHGELERFLKQAVREHGVHRVMLIGGDESESAGPWHDSVQLLASGVLRDAGVREIGIAAYPEGHPKIAQDALRRAFERRGATLRPARGSGRRASPRLRALRRPRRLRDGVRGARRRGDTRAAVELLRHEPPPDRAVRRHGRKVHRRCRDGGLGHRPRKTTPSGRCARRSTSWPPCGTRFRPPGAGGRPHGRGRRHGGRRGPGIITSGDLVNTASRVQSAAEPGTVLVGETTRRASEQAIAYEQAGAHELKGKAESDGGLPSSACRLRTWRRPEVNRPRSAIRRPRS